MTIPDVLERDLRHLGSVVGVGAARDADGLTIYLTISDPGQAEAVLADAQHLAAVRLGDDVRVEVVAPGVPAGRLALARDLASVPGVAECEVVRGSRGEVLRIGVTVLDSRAAKATRRLAAERLDEAFAADRLEVTIELPLP